MNPSQYALNRRSKSGLDCRCRDCFSARRAAKKAVSPRKRINYYVGLTPAQVRTKCMGTVKCRDCGKAKKAKKSSEFPINKTKKNGILSRCRVCARDAIRFRKYKITKSDFNKLVAKQKGKCPICKIAFMKSFKAVGSGKKKKVLPHIDYL
jgi:hypothetical protein